MCASVRRAKVESATTVADVIENFMTSVCVCVCIYMSRKGEVGFASNSLLEEERLFARRFLYQA